MKRKRMLCWPLAMGVMAAFFAVAFLWLGPYYAANDDAGIMRPFLGYETGEPIHFHIYLHGLLAWPLYAFSRLWPGVAWYSWLQLALLFVSGSVCIKGIAQCFLKHGRPMWQGAVAALAFGAAFVLPWIVRVTFTQTAALLAAAAVLQTLCIDYENAAQGEVIRGLCGALALVALAYALRQIVLLPALAFCGVAFTYVLGRYYGLGKRKRRGARTLFIFLLIAAVALGGLLGWREWEIRANGAQDYLAWQAATEPLMDRYGFAGIPQEEFDKVGWSPNTAALVGSQWFFLDESISTEAFEQLNRYVATTPMASMQSWLSNAAEIVTCFPRDNPGFVPQLWLLLALLAACALGAALSARGKRGWLGFALAGMVLLAAALLAYLAVCKGRMPLRAALQALLPLAAALAALLPACLEGRGARALSYAALAALVCLSGWYVCTALPGFHYEWTHPQENAASVDDLYSYALGEEDMFIIHDLTLAGGMDLFPDFSEGVPHNVSLWGGWGLRSAYSVRQFANYGIDLLHFDPATFLREDVLFACGVVDPPPNQLLSYLREKVDPNVDYMIYGENGFAYFFQFYIP